VSSSMVRTICTLAAASAWVATAAPRWRVQYFYDKYKSTMVIADFQFASPSRGVAVGEIEENRHRQPVALVTSDGGAHWQTVDLKATPISIFFLNENLGWMVATNGLWETTEAGKSWRKVPRFPSGMLRVYFSDEKNGLAAGTKKRVFETHDAGDHWTAVAAAAEPPGTPNYSVYSWIVFATPHLGLITGWNSPPHRFPKQFPDWMDPEGAVAYRDTPHLTYSMVTKDGGKTWKTASVSTFGDIRRVRLGAGGNGLGLVEYSNAFRYPSEAYKIDWATGKNSTVYRDKKVSISDVWLGPDGTAYLAGVTAAGELRNLVPGKVRVLKSRDKELTVWEDMLVDYRAVALRAFFAAAPGNNLWLATDNGMILKLEDTDPVH